MAKKPSLGAALSASAKGASATNPPPEKAPRTAVAARTKGRIGKVQIAGFFEPEVAKQLKALALDEETTVQLLVAEALNLLFSDRGKPQIADVTDRRNGREG